MEILDDSVQGIFDQAAVGIAQIGLDGSWLRVNNRYCQMLGYSESELGTKTICDITHPDDRDAVLAARRQLLEGAISSHSMEKRYIRRDGTIFWGRLNRSLVRDQDNLPKYFIAVVEDITEKVQAERALRDSERRLTLAQNAAHLGVWDRDLSGNVIVTSGEYYRLYGLAPDHPPLTHEEWLSLIHPEDRKRVGDLMRDTLQQTHVWDAEFRVVWPDGSVHWLLGKGTVSLDESGRPVRITGVNLDITDRRQAAAALQESEERFRNIADNAPVIIWVCGSDEQVTFVNSEALRFAGRTLEQDLGTGWIEIVHPDDLARMRTVISSAIEGRHGYQIEVRLRRADGEYRWILDTVTPRFAGGVYSGLIGSGIDITDFKRQQEQMHETQKLESLGVLASGVAHDFNNLLGSILSESELALSELPAGSPAREELQRIGTVAIRAAEIVGQLMAYAGQETEYERIDVSHLVQEMLGLLQVSVSKHGVLKADLPSGLPPVRANPAQLRQVVMNLITNASEALGKKDGAITITVARERVDPNSLASGAAEMPVGDYIRLMVSDTGCGMTEETRARIFEPFFTTKFVGRGLGLAAVRGIIRAHGGALDVVSALGQGSTFQILLPCAGEPVAWTQSPSADFPGEFPLQAKSILIVEDEDVLRLAVSKLLRNRGFSVIEAADGTAAVELLHTHKGEIGVVLLDFTLLGKSSPEIFEEARRLQPDVNVILTSAYGWEKVVCSFPELEFAKFIRKPYTASDLVRMLGEALPARRKSVPAVSHSEGAQ